MGGWFTTNLSQQLSAPQSDPTESAVIVELGPGPGVSLQEVMQNRNPSRVYGIEVSQPFREELIHKFHDEIESGLLSIHDNDAKSLPFLEDSSVDCVFAANTIYFLNPLAEYLTQMFRILKPGGKIVFGVSNAAKGMDLTIFINVDWDVCVESMVEAGFEDVTKGDELLDGKSAYIPLSGSKPK